MITRRHPVAGLAAGALGPAVLRARPAGAEPPPETTRIRLVKLGAICMSPMFVAEDPLRAEGFSDIQYVPQDTIGAGEQALARGEVDLILTYALRLVQQLDAGSPVVALAGVHTGCVELLGGPTVRALRDLKGKRVVAGRAATGLPGLLEIILAQVGLTREVELLNRSEGEALELFAQGKVEAFLGIPPEPQVLRARRIGRTVLDTGRDRPWSQYFCCLVVAGRDFHRRSPVAAKRAVRALLKAADMCSADPAGAARLVVDRGYTPSYDHARATLGELRYRAWREFDPEEALRFYALRLHEAGLIKTSPKKIAAEGGDWRILRELRKELKA